MGENLKERKREMIAALAEKVKSHNYCKDIYVIACGIALCDQNPNDKLYTIQTLIDYIDECKNEQEFLEKATALLKLDLSDTDTREN